MKVIIFLKEMKLEGNHFLETLVINFDTTNQISYHPYHKEAKDIYVYIIWAYYIDAK